MSTVLVPTKAKLISGEKRGQLFEHLHIHDVRVDVAEEADYGRPKLGHSSGRSPSSAAFANAS